MNELAEDTQNMTKKNLLGMKALRSYTGRCNHVANILYGWRPFMDTLWAAVAEKTAESRPTRAPGA